MAAHNHAAFEWIHHEHVARDHGLTTPQLSVIRDVASSPSPTGVLSPIHVAALAFADASTKDIKVSDGVFQGLAKALETLVDDKEKDKSEKVEDLLVEAAAVVATYNMVSRFLVSLDVAGKSDDLVPYPFDKEDVRLRLHHFCLV